MLVGWSLITVQLNRAVHFSCNDKMFIKTNPKCYSVTLWDSRVCALARLLTTARGKYVSLYIFSNKKWLKSNRFLLIFMLRLLPQDIKTSINFRSDTCIYYTRKGNLREPLLNLNEVVTSKTLDEISSFILDLIALI